MRLFVYERKSEFPGADDSWRSLLTVENDFLMGAQKEWDEVLAQWYPQGGTKTELDFLIQQGCKEARAEVVRALLARVPEVGGILADFLASGRCCLPQGSN